MAACTQQVGGPTARLAAHLASYCPPNRKTIPEIVLPVVQPIGKFRHEVLGLRQTNCDEPRHLVVQAPASRHRIVIDRTRHPDSATRENASEKNLSERRKRAAPEIHSGPEEVSKRFLVPACGRHVVAGEISHNAKPAVRVVLELTASAVSIERRRGGKSATLALMLKRT